MRACALNSESQNMRDRGNRPLYYCGCENPTPEMIARAEKFYARAIEKNDATGRKGFRAPAHRVSQKIFGPARPNDGFGKMWLDCFRDFRGNECVSFPFRTAAKPRGLVTYNFKRMDAHRAMCLMAHGLPKEDGKTMALHRCGNGNLGCCNPKHLYWGDQSDNNKDAWRHKLEGRQAA